MTLDERLETGIGNLDRELGDGIPYGSVTTIVTPANSQGEIFFDRFAETRPTLYISTKQSEIVINRRLSQLSGDSTLRNQNHVQVADLSDISNPDEFVGEFDDAITRFESQLSDNGVEEYNIIIDTIDRVERMGYEYVVDVFDVLQEHMYDLSGDSVQPCIVYLHALANNDSQTRQSTLNLSDVTMRLYRTRDDVEMRYFLFVLKNRFGKAIQEGLKVNIHETVKIDTSRNIG